MYNLPAWPTASLSGTHPALTPKNLPTPALGGVQTCSLQSGL